MTNPLTPQFSPCPECGKMPDDEHKVTAADPGAMYPCWFCGHVRVFDESLALRAPTEDEQQFIDSNHQIFFMRRFAAARRAFEAWRTENVQGDPKPDDALRFVLSGGLAVALGPPPPPAWTRYPRVQVLYEVSLTGGSEGAKVIRLLRPSEPDGPGPSALSCTSDEFDELTSQLCTKERELIAGAMDQLASYYPEDIFLPTSISPDAIAARAMRHAYQSAARVVREENFR